jgi:hypothetical protein
MYQLYLCFFERKSVLTNIASCINALQPLLVMINLNMSIVMFDVCMILLFIQSKIVALGRSILDNNLILDVILEMSDSIKKNQNKNSNIDIGSRLKQITFNCDGSCTVQFDRTINVGFNATDDLINTTITKNNQNLKNFAQETINEYNLNIKQAISVIFSYVTQKINFSSKTLKNIKKTQEKELTTYQVISIASLICFVLFYVTQAIAYDAVDLHLCNVFVMFIYHLYINFIESKNIITTIISCINVFQLLLVMINFNMSNIIFLITLFIHMSNVTLFSKFATIYAYLTQKAKKALIDIFHHLIKRSVSLIVLNFNLSSEYISNIFKDLLILKRPQTIRNNQPQQKQLGLGNGNNVSPVIPINTEEIVQNHNQGSGGLKPQNPVEIDLEQLRQQQEQQQEPLQSEKQKPTTGIITKLANVLRSITSLFGTKISLTSSNQQQIEKNNTSSLSRFQIDSNEKNNNLPSYISEEMMSDSYQEAYTVKQKAPLEAPSSFEKDTSVFNKIPIFDSIFSAQEKISINNANNTSDTSRMSIFDQMQENVKYSDHVRKSMQDSPSLMRNLLERLKLLLPTRRVPVQISSQQSELSNNIPQNKFENNDQKENNKVNQDKKDNNAQVGSELNSEDVKIHQNGQKPLSQQSDTSELLNQSTSTQASLNQSNLEDNTSFISRLFSKVTSLFGTKISLTSSISPLKKSEIIPSHEKLLKNPDDFKESKSNDSELQLEQPEQEQLSLSDGNSELPQKPSVEIYGEQKTIITERAQQSPVEINLEQLSEQDKQQKREQLNQEPEQKLTNGIISKLTNGIISSIVSFIKRKINSKNNLKEEALKNNEDRSSNQKEKQEKQEKQEKIIPSTKSNTFKTKLANGLQSITAFFSRKSSIEQQSTMKKTIDLESEAEEEKTNQDENKSGHAQQNNRNEVQNENRNVGVDNKLEDQSELLPQNPNILKKYYTQLTQVTNGVLANVDIKGSVRNLINDREFLIDMVIRSIIAFVLFIFTLNPILTFMESTISNIAILAPVTYQFLFNKKVTFVDIVIFFAQLFLCAIFLNNANTTLFALCTTSLFQCYAMQHSQQQLIDNAKKFFYDMSQEIITVPLTFTKLLIGTHEDMKKRQSYKSKISYVAILYILYNIINFTSFTGFFSALLSVACIFGPQIPLNEIPITNFEITLTSMQLGLLYCGNIHIFISTVLLIPTLIFGLLYRVPLNNDSIINIIRQITNRHNNIVQQIVELFSQAGITNASINLALPVLKSKIDEVLEKMQKLQSESIFSMQYLQYLALKGLAKYIELLIKRDNKNAKIDNRAANIPGRQALTNGITREIKISNSRENPRIIESSGQNTREESESEHSREESESEHSREESKQEHVREKSTQKNINPLLLIVTGSIMTFLVLSQFA